MKENLLLKNMIIALFLLSIFIPIKIHADGQLHMVLIKEFYGNGYINRQYRIQENHQLIFNSILVPKEYESTIEQSQDPLLTAKELLTKHDTDLGLTEKISELKNETINGYTGIPSVDPSIQLTFNQQQQYADLYTQGKIQLPPVQNSTTPTTPPEEKTTQKATTKEQIDKAREVDLDYTEINQKSNDVDEIQTKKEQKQIMEEMKKEEQKQKQNTSQKEEAKKQKSNDKTQNTNVIVVSIIIIVLLTGVSVILLRKKVR